MMKEQKSQQIYSQRKQSLTQKKGLTNSAQPQHRRQTNQFLKYLNSESSELVDQKAQLCQSIKTFQLEQKHYMACPQLYESYRNEQCIEEIKGDSFRVLKYSKGRNQLRFGDAIQIEIPNVVKLTVWNNGDYKLIYNEEVYFWHEEQRSLDKYCVTI